MPDEVDSEREEMWRRILTGEDPRFRQGRRWRRMIPSRERCKNCHSPFAGVGGWLMRRLGRGRYDRNPRFCDY